MKRSTFCWLLAPLLVLAAFADITKMNGVSITTATKINGAVRAKANGIAITSGVSYTSTVLADSPLGYWKLGDSSGTAAVDQTSTQNGLYVGSPTLGVTGIPGGAGNTAVTFDGNTQSMTVADNAAWDVTSGTVEAWFKTSLNHAALARNIAQRDNDTQRNYLLRVNTANKLEALLLFDSFPSVVSSGTVNDGNWHHAVLTWSLSAGTTTMTLYLDGSSQGTNTASGSMPATARPLYWGASESAFSYWAGDLDELAYYGTALNSTRVSAHYTVGSTP